MTEKDSTPFAISIKRIETMKDDKDRRVVKLTEIYHGKNFEDEFQKLVDDEANNKYVDNEEYTSGYKEFEVARELVFKYFNSIIDKGYDIKNDIKTDKLDESPNHNFYYEVTIA